MIGTIARKGEYPRLPRIHTLQLTKSDDKQRAAVVNSQIGMDALQAQNPDK
jgi:hypothetical protein